MTPSSQDLIAFLERNQFLAPAYQELLERDREKYTRAENLLEDILSNGWITPFQFRWLGEGQGDRLIVGPYRLLEQLGEGGMGVVYKAVHPKLNRIVALKLIRPQLLQARPELVHRFHREARAIAQLLHPNVVILYDAGEVDGNHFLAMEYVEGMTLDRMVRMQGPLPIKQAADFIRQAALGLQHASDEGLVHRDIKPGNLVVAQKSSSPGKRSSSVNRKPQLVTQRDKRMAIDTSTPSSKNAMGSWGVVKILDMGLARLQESLEDGPEHSPLTPLTRAGTLLGTPDFIAPEQARDPRSVDIRADLYSLGCTFYFLLTGRTPFPGGSDVEKIIRHQTDKPVPLEELRPHIPTAITTIVNRLLQKKPQDRFDSPQDLADDLQVFLTQAQTGATAQESVVTRNEFVLPVPASLAANLPAPMALTIENRARPEVVAKSPVPFVTSKDEAPTSFGAASPESDTKQLFKLVSHPAHLGAVAGAAISSDGRFACSGGIDGRIRLWDLNSGQPREVASTQRSGLEIETVAINPDGGAVVIGAITSGNALVWCWDWREDKFYDWGAFATSHSRGVGAMSFSSDGKMFAAGVGSFVVTWKTAGKVASGRTIVKGHTSPVRALAFSPDRRLLASGGDGKNSRIWSFGWLGASMKIKLKGHGDHVTSIDFSPNGQYFASGSLDRSILVWDLSNPSELPVQTLSGHTASVRLIRFLPDNRHLVSVTDNGQLIVWDFASGARIVAHVFETGTVVTSVALSPDFQRLCVGGSDGKVTFFALDPSFMRPATATVFG